MAKLNNFFALDISDNSLEIMECQRNFWGKIIIENINRLNIDKGIIVNGSIKNPNALVKLLKKAISTAKPGKITSRYCLLSIPENKVFTHIFHVPTNLPDDDIEDFVLNQAEGIIPFNRETVLSDWEIIEEDAKEKQVLYAAVPKKLINDIIAILKRLGITVLLIELESLSVARALLAKQSAKEASTIVDIGGNFSNITIFDREGLKVTVSLPMAGNHFTREIRLKGKMTLAKAERIKQSKGLRLSQQSVVKGLRHSLNKIIEEIKRSIVYYERKSNRQVKNVLLVGGSIKMPGLLDYFKEKLSIKVIIGNPWYRLRKSGGVLKVFSQKDGPFFSTVMGLILRGSSKNYKKGLNLLPTKSKKTGFIKISQGNKIEWPKLILLLVIIVVLTLLFIFKDEIQNNKRSLGAPAVQVMERQISFSVSYDEQSITNLQTSRIKAKTVQQIGAAEAILEDITPADIFILADDYLSIINDSDDEVTLVANSRLSQNDMVYYLTDTVRIKVGGSQVAQVRGDGSKPIKLEEGRYNFIALPAARQELIYGEKVYEIASLSPEQAVQIDIIKFAQAQEVLQLAAKANALTQLGDGYYLDEPIGTNVQRIKYGRIGNQIVIRGIIEYQFIQIPANDLLMLTLNNLKDDNITMDSLEKAEVQLLADNINDIEQTVRVRALWKIYY